MAITASVVAVVALIAAIVMVNPFGSSAAKTTSGGLAAPTVTSGASAQATGSARSSRTGKKQRGPGAGGTGAQATNGAVSGTSKKAGAHPSSGATTPSSASTTSGTTDADGFTILDASSSEEVHHCEQLGIDRRGYQAIVCFDIDTYTSGGDYYAVGKVEAFCQTIAGAAAQCVQITLGGLYTEGASGTETQESWTCGGSAAACPDGRWVETLTTFEWSDSNSGNCSNGTSPANDVWDEVVGVTTQIELPVSDATYVLNASDGGNDGDNYSSGHYWVCQSLTLGAGPISSLTVNQNHPHPASPGPLAAGFILIYPPRSR